jgi:hypothetical protein
MCDCRSGDENHKTPLEEAQCTPSWKLVFPFGLKIDDLLLWMDGDGVPLVPGAQEGTRR